MTTRTWVAWVTAAAVAVGFGSGLSCGGDSHHGNDGESFTCQAVCNSAAGQLGGESGEYSASNSIEAADDCVADQSRNADLCAGIGTFAGRCSCDE